MILCGALAACTMGTFTSCSDDDDRSSYDEYLDTKINEINKAIASNLSIINVLSDGGSYVLTLSDGSKITTGADIDVTVEANCIKLTVGGKVYEIPKSGGGSLQFAPEYADGEVRIGDASGATVMFIPNPALTSLAGVEPSVAVAYELKTRSADQFKVTFDEINTDGMIVGKLYCLDQDLAGKTVGVSVQMDNNGTVLGSNVFTVKVADDFSFSSEEIDPSIVPADGTAANADGSFTLPAISGASLGAGFDMKSLFSNLPDGVSFKAASASKQPAGKAQEKASIIAKSVKADGTFSWAARPGTDFNENEEQPGFLININNVAETTVAKFYITINDEIAGANFNVFGSDMEVEWGNRTNFLQLGAQRLDVQAWLASAQDEEGGLICHNGLEGVIQKWNDVAVTTPGNKSILMSAGGELTLDELGQAYAPEGVCRGIFWYYRGLSIRLPESMAPYTDHLGVEWTSGGEGWGKDYFVNGDDMWWGQYNEFIEKAWEEFAPPTAVHLGIRVDEKTGELITPENYTGWGMRIAYGVGYEYLYGVKNITAEGNDKLGMIFFNRRVAPEGATMPEGDK